MTIEVNWLKRVKPTEPLKPLCNGKSAEFHDWNPIEGKPWWYLECYYCSTPNPRNAEHV